jgi:hypothetical protein
MGPPEGATARGEKQAAGRKKPIRRPRRRSCLLKGCEQRFRPRQAGQRYCSPQCRQAARRWSRWKAQQRYRSTAAGQAKRNGQCRRYRQRSKRREATQPEAVGEAARVITLAAFFRARLRPAGLLRVLRPTAAKSLTTFLFAELPACRGARPRTGAALAGGARLSPEILIGRPPSP